MGAITVLAYAMRAVETKQRSMPFQDVKEPTAQNLFVYFGAELRWKEVEKS